MATGGHLRRGKGKERRTVGQESHPPSEAHQKFKFFPAHEPFLSVGLEILGPLTDSTRGRRFLLVITDLLSMLKKAVRLPKIDAFYVSEYFAEP